MITRSRDPAGEAVPDRAALARRLVRNNAIAIGGANVIGGVLVGVFLVWVVPVPVPRALGRNVNLILAVGYLIAASIAGQLLGRRTGAPVLSWLREGRQPDPHEREVTLRQALLQARNVAALWAFGAVLFAAVNASYSAALALEVGVTVAMGGVMTTALCYLVAERLGRPVMALALAEHPPRQAVMPGIATRMVLAWSCGTAVAVLGAALVAAEYLAAGPSSPRRMALTVLFLCAAALLAGLATALFAARSVADPLESIRLALAEVEAGSTDVEVPVYDGNEVGLVQAGFNSMVAGLRERERIRDLFGRHVGEDVARQALTRGISLGGETHDAAILFVDLVGSTTLAASEEPGEVVAILNRFFAIVVEVITRHGGWVNKFEGDAALCVFGALVEHPHAAAASLAAGRELCVRLRHDLPTLAAGIGLSAGEAVAGNIGAADRFEYTVIGDPVNEAARLADLAKTEPDRLLATEAVVARAGASEAGHWRLGDTVTLRGRLTPTRLATPADRARAPEPAAG